MSDAGIVRVGEWSLKLGPVQWAMLKTLHAANGRPVSHEALYRGLYAGAHDPPSENVVRVHLCYLQRKLRGSGIKIINRFGFGWFLGRTDAKAST